MRRRRRLKRDVRLGAHLGLLIFQTFALGACIRFIGQRIEIGAARQRRPTSDLVGQCGRSAHFVLPSLLTVERCFISNPMKAIQGYHLIKPEELFWRPSNL